MRTTFIFLTLLFLMVTQELAAQTWSEQTSNYDSTLTNVYFVNQDIGYVCGSKGTILKTVNGGTNWVAQNSGVTDGLAVIQFIGKDIGYASGGWVSGAKKNCTLVKTINGGDTWTKVNVSASKCGAGIWFVSADTGFYAYADSLYGNSAIAKTTNGGASWNVVYSGTGWISYFYFTDSKNGYATVNNGSVLKTTDGGQNWTSLNLGEKLWGSGIFFFSKDTGFVGGHPSRTSGIFKTVNGGTSWQSLSAGNSFFKIFFADRNNGYALNVDSTFVGYMIKSTDGGANWLDEPTPKKGLWGIYFLNTNLGYAVGDNGVILKYSFATSVFPPIVPQNLTATAGNGQVTLTWNKNTETDFLKYLIYMGTDSSSVTLKDSTTASISDTTKIISGLTIGTKYYFRVSALNSARLESGQSIAISTTVVSMSSPADDLALHADASASDDGWGGGSSKSDITDGLRTYGDEWARGLAFWYGEWHQATIDFGHQVTFNKVTQWYHGGMNNNEAAAYKLQYWSGSNWVDIFETNNSHAYLKYPDASVSDWYYFWSTPYENTFAPVVSDKLRILNYPLNGSHTWLWEVEVYYTSQVFWQMQIKAGVSSVVDNENFAGVVDSASEGFDASFDTPEPPTSPGSYVSLFFPHPEWSSILGNNFAKDIKKNTSVADTVKRWYFQVQSNVVNDTVTLSFINDRIPSAFGKYLTDFKTGKRINLKNTSQYKYYTSDTVRSFMLVIGDTTSPSLTLTSPNGSNIWRSGTSKNIAWSTSDGTGIDSVFVYSSSNGGSSYSLLKSLGPVQSTSWTVPSEYLNNNYSIKIVSRDSLGNQSTTRSAKTFTVVGDSLAKSNSAGWSLVSTPLTPNDSSIANIFGTTSYLWYYTQATGYTQPSKIALGNGYWLGVTAIKNWFVKGIASEADSSIQNLQLGYNLIGNNFVCNVSKNNLYFLQSGSYYDFNSAVTAGLISNSLYGYSSSAYSSIDTMSLFGGYWIGVLQSGVQLIQKPNVSIVTPLAKCSQIFAMNWDLPISVSTPSLADNIAVIGIKPTSTGDFDPQYDAPRPPRNPGDKYLEMYFTNTGGNYPAILGSKYAKDYRGSDNPVWSFTIESSDQGTVSLHWDPNVLKQLGDNVKLALTDQGTLHSIDMSAQSSYSFNYSSPRSFTIASTITGVEDNDQNKPTSYALRQNYPNPFNPSTTIQYGLPTRSAVRLVIYNMLGQVVIELINSEQQAGYQSVVWNANVVSGLYFYRLEAVSVEDPSKRFVETKKMLLLK